MRHFHSFRVVFSISSVLLLLWWKDLPAGQTPIKEIDLSCSPDCLPYTIRIFRQYGAGDHICWFGSLDYDRDGGEEILYAYSDDAGGCTYASAIVGMSGALISRSIFQYNGIYADRKIWHVFDMDFAGDYGKDLALIKTIADSVIIEILVFGNSAIVDTLFIPAAVVRPGFSYENWHDLFVMPHAVLDINGDDSKDIIFSRSSKVSGNIAADSAFERGLIAYDITGDSILWFYPLADLVFAGNLWSIARPEMPTFFIGVTSITMNSYAVNGMDSRHGYIFAVDINGQEIWRREYGEGFQNPVLARYDSNGDSVPEIYLDMQEEAGKGDRYVFVCIDPITGHTIYQTEAIDGPAKSVHLLAATNGYRPSIIRYSNAPKIDRIYKYSPSLQLEGIFEGHFRNIELIEDIMGFGYPQILIKDQQNRLAILDTTFQPIAVNLVSGNVSSIYRGHEVFGVLYHGLTSNALITVENTPLALMLYARYKWWLAVILAMVGFAGFYRLWLRIERLRLGWMGLPSLDRINALVLVLDRKHRILFTNNNPLVQTLFSGPIGRQPLARSRLSEYPQIIDLLERAFDSPLTPIQERLELIVDGSTCVMELTIYPRLDQHNNATGLILIGEDVSQKAGWERKVVLGEAAQRWVHKLKRNMATVNITLENIYENEHVGAVIERNEGLKNYLSLIRLNIADSADTAAKILRFARISKPVISKCDLNRIISEVVELYIANPVPGVKVVKNLQNNLSPIDADPDQIHEVIDNLLSNAVMAIADSGTITIRTQSANDLHTNSDGIVMIIEDTGIGMTGEITARIFEPGYSKSGGTGIGLAIVKEILDNHAARIEVMSQPGRGSRFTVWFK